MSRSSGERAGGAGQLVEDLTRRDRAREWLLLTGNRLHVSAALLVIVAVAIVLPVASGFVPLRVRTPILFMLFALISGNFVLITIVVSLNQFILTRHLESPDEIKERMDQMLQYREDVARSTRQTVLPITPSGFLSVLFASLARQGRDLERELPELENERAQANLRRLTVEIGSHTDRVTELLETAPRGVQPALFTSLNTSYASYIHLASHIESKYSGALTEETRNLLGDLVRSLEHVDVARRFFKTVLIQTELAELSRLLLYIGLPVQVVTIVLLLSFSAPVAVGPPRLVVLVVVPAIVIVGFMPIIILASFIFRLSTVAQRTAAMYPFTEQPSGIGPVFEVGGLDDR